MAHRVRPPFRALSFPHDLLIFWNRSYGILTEHSTDRSAAFLDESSRSTATRRLSYRRADGFQSCRVTACESFALHRLSPPPLGWNSRKGNLYYGVENSGPVNRLIASVNPTMRVLVPGLIVVVVQSLRRLSPKRLIFWELLGSLVT